MDKTARSEYWKSNPRKFCEYCKCWFADNKSSTDFHERGKRHQEAVAAKISELQRKGIQDAKDKARFKTDMEKMEEAAMAALKKDLRNDPSLAAAYGMKVKESGCAPMPANFKEPEPDPESEPEPEPEAKVKKKLWKALTSPQGYTYYWDMESNDVTWTKPDDYEADPSPEDLESDSQAELTKEIKKSEKPVVAPSPQLPSTIPLPSQPVSKTAVQAGVTPQERRAEKRPAAGAYGSWQQVEEPEQPDLQLPPPAEPRITPQSTAYKEPPKINFKPKTVSSLGGASLGGANLTSKTGIVFKKRKVNAGNMRSRDEES